MSTALFIILLSFCSKYFAQQAPSPLDISTTYSVTFNTLQGGIEGTELPFVEGTTVMGWWSSETTYIISDGSSNEGGLYSFGARSSTERALGAITSNKRKTVLIGASLTFNSSVQITQVSYVGEQWRYGGDNVSDILQFDYSVMTLAKYQSGGWGGIPGGDLSDWVRVPQLDFVSPVNKSSNVPIGPVANITRALSADLNAAVPAGNVLQLRWTARNQRDGLGIDDVKIVVSSGDSPTPIPTSSPTFSPTPTPEPTKEGNTMWKTIALSGWTLFGGSFILFVIAVALLYRRWRLQLVRQEQEAQRLVADKLEGVSPPGFYGVYTKLKKAVANGWSIPTPNHPTQELDNFLDTMEPQIFSRNEPHHPSQYQLLSQQIQLPQLQQPHFPQQNIAQNNVHDTHPVDHNCPQCGQNVN